MAMMSVISPYDDMRGNRYSEPVAREQRQFATTMLESFEAGSLLLFFFNSQRNTERDVTENKFNEDLAERDRTGELRQYLASHSDEPYLPIADDAVFLIRNDILFKTTIQVVAQKSNRRPYGYVIVSPLVRYPLFD